MIPKFYEYIMAVELAVRPNIPHILVRNNEDSLYFHNTLTACTLFCLKQSFWRGLVPSSSYTKIRSLGHKSLMILMFWIGSRYRKCNSPCWNALRTLFIPSPLRRLKMKDTYHLQTSILHCSVPISLLKCSLIWFSSTEAALRWAVIPLLIYLGDH